MMLVSNITQPLRPRFSSKVLVHESRVSFIYVCIDTYSAYLVHSYLLA